MSSELLVAQRTSWIRVSRPETLTFVHGTRRATRLSVLQEHAVSVHPDALAAGHSPAPHLDAVVSWCETAMPGGTNWILSCDECAIVDMRRCRDGSISLEPDGSHCVSPPGQTGRWFRPELRASRAGMRARRAATIASIAMIASKQDAPSRSNRVASKTSGFALRTENQSPRMCA